MSPTLQSILFCSLAIGIGFSVGFYLLESFLESRIKGAIYLAVGSILGLFMIIGIYNHVNSSIYIRNHPIKGRALAFFHYVETDIDIMDFSLPLTGNEIGGLFLLAFSFYLIGRGLRIFAESMPRERPDQAG